MGGLLEPGALSTEPSVHKSLKDYKTAMNSIREGNNSSLRPEDETIDGFLVNQPYHEDGTFVRATASILHCSALASFDLR